MDEKEFKKKLRNIERKNNDYYRKQLLKSKKAYRIKMPSMSKIIVATVLVVCVQIIAFAEYMMIKTNDMSCMYTLIGVPVTLVPVLLGYFNKSVKENTSGGIIYDSAMKEEKASG